MSQQERVYFPGGYYLITSNLLGRGTFGTVYPTKLIQNDKVINDNLSVKRIPCDELTVEKKKYLDREVKALQSIKQLHNINIVKIYDIILESDNLNIFMENCERGDLELVMMEKNNKFKLEEVLYIFGSIVNAFKGLQSLGFIHRDLKPANILVDNNWIYKLSDFGTSRIIDGIQDSKDQLTYVGSAKYMAPQPFLGLSYSAKLDVFSLGAILHELIYLGKSYSDSPSKPTLKKAVVELQRTPHKCDKCVSSFIVPNELKQIVEQMLKFHEEDRPSWQDLYLHPLIKKFVTQENRTSDQVQTQIRPITQSSHIVDQAPTRMRKSSIRIISQQPDQSQVSQGKEDLEQTVKTSSSLYSNSEVMVGELVTKSQKTEKLMKILLKKGDTAFATVGLLQNFAQEYPQQFDLDFMILNLALLNYKYRTILSSYGLINNQLQFVTPQITDILNKEFSFNASWDFTQSNLNLFKTYNNQIALQVSHFYAMMKAFESDYLQKVQNKPHLSWITQMLNDQSHDCLPYLQSIRYLYQEIIKQKLNQVLCSAYWPNQILIAKIIYYLELLMRIDQKYPFSHYLFINEQVIGQLPDANNLQQELIAIQQEQIV